jgi:hypothetical protein
MATASGSTSSFEFVRAVATNEFQTSKKLSIVMRSDKVIGQFKR